MKLGKDLAEITAGIDLLYRQQQHGEGFLNAEGLIPVAVAEVTPRAFSDYAAARDALAEFEGRISAEAESDLRRDYLIEMADSLVSLVDMFDKKPVSFAQRLKRQLRVDTTVIGPAFLDAYRANIREGLDELGYREGDIATDLGRWEQDNHVPRENVISVLGELLEKSREKTAERMYDFTHEWIEPVGVSDKPFSAYCDYPGRQVMLNLDFPYTTYSLKHLATHEAFPGHLVHLGLREKYVAEGKMPLDGAQVVTNSASSPLFEGIADNGMAFLDWLDTPGDKIAVNLGKLRSALRCNAAWMVHEEKQPLEDVIPVIAKEAYQSVETVTGRLAFLHHELRAPFVYAYWCGDEIVENVWKSGKSDPKRFWAYLYENMHTPSTLKAHWT